MDDRTRNAIRTSINNMKLDGRDERRMNQYLTNHFGYRKITSAKEFVRVMTELRAAGNEQFT